jgi:hypothetical protein
MPPPLNHPPPPTTNDNDDDDDLGPMPLISLGDTELMRRWIDASPMMLARCCHFFNGKRRPAQVYLFTSTNTIFSTTQHHHWNDY